MCSLDALQVRHCGATFGFDFRHVYWNSRLQHEHEILVTEHIPVGAVVADVFCARRPLCHPPGAGTAPLHSLHC